ncbi:cysteine proteinases superfamily protein [Striga asiatica]|uniref:Cysteine proteinases superfamily protein n=1 Tax=Striga asiatica TaxID=4170 RepID=A0A5A7QBA9_STRAF|nr:cysteine proteinases superfamily protein [Striga asiatica]
MTKLNQRSCKLKRRKERKLRREDMKSNKCPLIRPIGQRSITSTFLSSHRDCEGDANIKAPNRKVIRENSDKSVNGGSQKKEEREEESKFLIDGAFDMFKNVQKNSKGLDTSSSDNDTNIFCIDHIHETQKRKNLNEDKPAGRKRMAVLGEDSKPALRPRVKRNFPANDESIPHFNHYENGGGWWNDDMAGVDTEEVGCKNDAWEGVGRTTLGGIEWH